MFKKILKWSGITLLTLIVILAIIPFAFKKQIKEKIVASLNENVNARVTLEDVNVSLLKDFPKATVSVAKICVINRAPFDGDTLVYSEKINLKMGISELFHGENKPMKIDGFSTENTILKIIFNKDGVGNYDIALKNKKPEKNKSKSKPFSLDIEKYDVENLKFTYLDESSKMKLILDSIYHQGKGNLAQDKLDLETKTKANMSFNIDKSNFLRNTKVSLDAILGIDLKNSKYTFKENKALINQLPLEFNGYIQMVEKGQIYDLAFKTPRSEFKNFLALIPEQYAGNLEGVETTGKFEVIGKVNGKLTENTVPKFDIEMASNNASFHYKDLPKTVKNINIDTHIINESGIVNDTYINIANVGFAIDQDVFNAKATVKNIVENAVVNAELKGRINLANVSKAYPIKLEKNLNGILKADVKTAFDMKSIATNQYQNSKNAGRITLTGFNYTGSEMAKPVSISIADVVFNPSKINLTKLNLKTGKSDVNVSGMIENLYGFLFKNQILKGTFNLNSNTFAVADFMMPTTVKTKTGDKKTEAVKIPSFLDCTLTAKAKTVIYDNLNLKNVSGSVTVKNESVKLSNLKMDVFSGKLELNGLVSTKGKIPTFDMNLGLNKVDIRQTFSAMNTLKTIAPIADVINGKLNSTIKLNGTLNKTMLPNVNTLSGNLMSSILSGSLNKNNSKLLTELDNTASFIDLKDMNLKDVKVSLLFKNGKVNVKPFTIKQNDIAVQIMGTHGFDKTINYNLKFDVPAKYLGKEIGNLITKLTPNASKKIENVPVNALLTGTFQNPKISTDIKQATTNLATQLVKMQKEKLLNEGTNILSNVLNDTKKNTSNDSIKTTPKDKITNGIKDGINNFFKKKK